MEAVLAASRPRTIAALDVEPALFLELRWCYSEMMLLLHSSSSALPNWDRLLNPGANPLFSDIIIMIRHLFTCLTLSIREDKRAN